MVHSLLMGAAKLGVNFAVATPEGYEPDKEVLEMSRDMASKMGASIYVAQIPRKRLRMPMSYIRMFGRAWASRRSRRSGRSRSSIIK